MRYRWILLIFLLFISCQKDSGQQGNASINLPATPIFSTESYWGVVSEPYLKIFQYMTNREDIVTTCRKGDILEITQRKLDDQGTIWLQVKFKDQEGWVTSDRIMLFDNKEQALVASSE